MTPQTQFTPGPWKTERRTFNYGCYGHEISTTEDSQRVFVTPRRPVIATIQSDEDEDRSNARLIASAPSLYAALQALLEFAEQYGPSERASDADWSGYLKDAREALDLGSSTPC